jgi:hypothetical protein
MLRCIPIPHDADRQPVALRPNDPWPVPDRRTRIIAEIPLLDAGVDGGSGGIAVGAGSAWVGLQRGETGPGSVVRIDLATNEIAAEIPLRDTPWRDRIAATEEAECVASSELLERIDPTRNTVVARAELPDRSITAVTADDAAVWMVTIRDEGGQPTGTLVRIDTATKEIAAEIPLGPQVAGYADQVMLGAGAVWVLGIRWLGEEDAEHGSDLIRIDPATNAIVARIPHRWLRHGDGHGRSVGSLPGRQRIRRSRAVALDPGGRDDERTVRSPSSSRTAGCGS